MYREQIEQWFEDHREEMVKDIMDLVAIPSVDGEARPGKPYGEGPAAAWRWWLRARAGPYVSRLSPWSKME